MCDDCSSLCSMYVIMSFVCLKHTIYIYPYIMSNSFSLNTNRVFERKWFCDVSFTTQIGRLQKEVETPSRESGRNSMYSWSLLVCPLVAGIAGSSKCTSLSEENNITQNELQNKVKTSSKRIWKCNQVTTWSCRSALWSLFMPIHPTWSLHTHSVYFFVRPSDLQMFKLQVRTFYVSRRQIKHQDGSWWSKSSESTHSSHCTLLNRLWRPP